MEVRQLQAGTLSTDDERKLNYHVRLTRGELFFARCWLLVEGETDFTVLREAAEVLDLDLDAAGVRVIPFANVGVESLIKAADDLGIGWFCMADSDRKDYQNAIRSCLHGRQEADHLALLPQENIEVFLCESGFGSIYEKYISKQKRSQLTKKAGDPGYWQNVMACLSNKAKPGVALEAMEAMRKAGKQAVPPLLRQVLEQAINLAGQ